MEFIKSYIYWIIGGVVIIGLIIVGIIYYGGAPDGETKFVIIPLSESDPFPYDFSGSDSDWIGDYTKEFSKIAPSTNNSSLSTPIPIPIPTPPSQETPWEQGPSDQVGTSPPVSPPSSQTPWEQGPSD